MFLNDSQNKIYCHTLCTPWRLALLALEFVSTSESFARLLFPKSSTISSSVMSYWFTMILRMWNTLSKVVMLPIHLPFLTNSGITYDTDRTRSNVVLR